MRSDLKSEWNVTAWHASDKLGCLLISLLRRGRQRLRWIRVSEMRWRNRGADRDWGHARQWNRCSHLLHLRIRWIGLHRRRRLRIKWRLINQWHGRRRCNGIRSDDVLLWQLFADWGMRIGLAGLEDRLESGQIRNRRWWRYIRSELLWVECGHGCS